MKLFGLLFAIAILVAYKFLWPWTPLWVDLIVMTVSAILYVSSVKSREAQNDEECEE